MSSNRPIGILDSGFGGLSVARAIRAAIPNEDLVFAADCAYAPYGDNSSEYIQARLEHVVSFLLAQQVKALADAGSELVRITVNSPEAAAKVAEIRQRLDDMGCNTPLIGDFHFNGERLLAEFPDCAQALSKYRINPGNVGHGKKRDEQFAQMIEIACKYDKPVRIGVNWGSLDQSVLARIMDENAKRAVPRDAMAVMREALVTSALESAAKAEEYGLGRDKIILSAKVSSVQDLIAVYRDMAAKCDYPLHLGLTEAGMGSKGIVASTAALAVLLQEGIGDTIRVSLTPEPQRQPHPGGRGRPGDPADHGPARLHPDGHRLPGLWPHHQHAVPGDGLRRAELRA